MNKKGFTQLLVCFLISACTGTSYVAVDGMAVANVFTWEDINNNGVPDKGEPSLPFVTTSIGYPDFITSSEGWGSPSKFMPGCAKNCSEGETVSVKVPPGYKPTTPTSYILTGVKNSYYFGFHSNSENENISFPNEPDWQKAFINRGAKILAFHYSADNQLEITVDRDGTILDNYYPKSFQADESYFDVFIFDVVLNLQNQHNINIPELKVIVMPANSIFSCKTSDIEEWTGRISGYEILTKYCEQKQ